MNSDLRSIDFILISSTDYSEKICYSSFFIFRSIITISTMRKDIGLKQAFVVKSCFHFCNTINLAESVDFFHDAFCNSLQIVNYFFV